MDLNRYQALIEAGGQHLSEGRRGEAAKAFADADAMATDANQPPLRIGPVMALIHLAELDQNLETASRLADLLIKLATVSGAVQYVFIARLLRLQHLYRLERFDEALKGCPATFESARTFGDEGVDERLSHVYTLRGRVLLGLGRASDAAADFREALKLGAERTLQLRIALAQARVRSRDRSADLAIELEECLHDATVEHTSSSPHETQPGVTAPPSEDLRMATLALVELRLARGETDAARRAFEALNLPPGPNSDPAVMLFGAELAIAEDRFAEALLWLGEDPLPSRLELVRARALASASREWEAMATLSRVLAARDEHFVEATVLHADIFLKLDAHSECRAMARSITDDPSASPGTRARGLVILARERLGNGDAAQAKLFFHEALSAAFKDQDHALTATIGIEALQNGVDDSFLEAIVRATIQSADLRLIVELALTQASMSIALGRLDEAQMHLAQARLQSAGDIALTRRVERYAMRHEGSRPGVDSVH